MAHGATGAKKRRSSAQLLSTYAAADRGLLRRTLLSPHADRVPHRLRPGVSAGEHRRDRGLAGAGSGWERIPLLARVGQWHAGCAVLFNLVGRKRVIFLKSRIM